MIDYRSMLPPFFSEELIEDSIAAKLIRSNKMTPEGFILLQKLFNKNVLLFRRSCKHKLMQAYRFNIYIPGQPTTPVNISVTPEEIANRLHPLGIRILFHGSGIWRIIAPMCGSVLQEWLTDLKEPLDNFISPHFHHLRAANPNDMDWEIWAAPAKDNNSPASLDTLTDAFITLLAEKFAKNNFSKSDLIQAIKKLQRTSINFPPNSYLFQLLKHKKIPYDYMGVCKLYIECFAFTNAVNIARPGAHHCLRSVGSNLPHDFLFAQEARTTRMHFNSLFINTTPIFQNCNTKLKLVSCINPEDACPVVQAIMDANLNLLTFDRTKSLDTSDFIRTLISFTFGSRCYQAGVLNDLVSAAVKEAEFLQIPLSQMLAQRFLHWFTTHEKEHSTLIALAFNTCALLDFYNIDLEEVEGLWELLLDSVNSQKSNIPLFAQIQAERKSLSFVDLYSLIQISSHISQHHDSISCSFATQTNGRPYVQMKFKIENAKEEAFTLFFPYNLSKSINCLNQLQEVPNCLLDIHKTLIGHEKLKFKFDHSSRKQHANDLSRAFYSCLVGTNTMLEKQNPILWFFGFQITLAQLAQKSDSKTIQVLWNHFLCLLECKWASQAFITSIIDEFHATLQINDVKINCGDFIFLYEKIKAGELSSGYERIILSLLKNKSPFYTDLAISLGTKLNIDVPNECLETMDNMLEKQNPFLSFFGSLRTFSELAQNSDSATIQQLWEGFFCLLECNRFSEAFITFIIEEFQATLQSNGLKINHEDFIFLYEMIKTKDLPSGYERIVLSLLKLKNSIYTDLALSLSGNLNIDQQSESHTLDKIKNIYFNNINNNTIPIKIKLNRNHPCYFYPNMIEAASSATNYFMPFVVQILNKTQSTTSIDNAGKIKNSLKLKLFSNIKGEISKQIEAVFDINSTYVSIEEKYINIHVHAQRINKYLPTKPFLLSSNSKFISNPSPLVVRQIYVKFLLDNTIYEAECPVLLLNSNSIKKQDCVWLNDTNSIVDLFSTLNTMKFSELS